HRPARVSKKALSSARVPAGNPVRTRFGGRPPLFHSLPAGIQGLLFSPLSSLLLPVEVDRERDAKGHEQDAHTSQNVPHQIELLGGADGFVILLLAARSLGQKNRATCDSLTGQQSDKHHEKRLENTPHVVTLHPRRTIIDPLSGGRTADI